MTCINQVSEPDCPIPLVASYNKHSRLLREDPEYCRAVVKAIAHPDVDPGLNAYMGTMCEANFWLFRQDIAGILTKAV